MNQNLLTEQTAEKGVQKITATIEKGAQRVVDAVGKIKITNNTQSVPVTEAKPVPAGVVAVCKGLRSIAAATDKTADFLQSHPKEARAASESAKAIAERLTGLTTAISDASASGDKLRRATDEATSASEWIGDNFLNGGCGQCAPVINSYGRVVGGFSELLNQG